MKLVAALLRVARVTVGLAEVMAAYRRVYDSSHLQADCQEQGSAPEPYARRSVIEYGAATFTITFYGHNVD